MHVDGVISDMAPNTSGIQFADQERSLALCEGALEVAIDLVVTGGFFLCKIFEGPGTKDFEKKLSERFRDITRERPRAVRKASKEFYFLAKGRL
jgi:23S rRNA (uridine2552-2'-O)-methyltransferase